MKSAKSYLIAFLALTTLGGSWLAWRQYAELVELRAAAMNKDERADLQKRAWDLEKQNKQMRDQLATRSPGEDAEGSAAAAGSAPADRRDRGGRGGGNPMQQFEAIRDLMAKPEVQALLSGQQKAAVDARYAALFKSLNLTPDQAEKLKTVLAERQTTLMDVMSAARDQGLDPRRDRDAYQKLMEGTRTDLNNSIKSVIGESGFTQFENYEKTLPQRNVVSQLQQRLSYSDTPLTTVQAEQLVQILAANTPAQTTATAPASDRNSGPGPGRGGPDLGFLGAVIGGSLGGGPPAGGPGGGLITLGGGGGDLRGGTTSAPITATAVNQAQAVLAAPQVTALQQLQQQQQNQQQLAKIVADTLATQNTTTVPAMRPAPATPPSTGKKPGG